MSEAKRFLSILLIVVMAIFAVYYFKTSYFKKGVQNDSYTYFKDMFFVYKDTCTSGYGCVIFPSVEILDNVDPKTFSCFPLGTYCKDSRHIFYDGEIFNGVDYETFKPLYIGVAKDKNHVYLKNNVYDIADAESFKSLEHGRFEDKNYSYRSGSVGVMEKINK